MADNIDNTNNNDGLVPEEKPIFKNNGNLSLFDPSGDDKSKAQENTYDVFELYANGMDFKQIGQIYNDPNNKFVLNSKEYNKKHHNDLYDGSDEDWDMMQNFLERNYRELEQGTYSEKAHQTQAGLGQYSYDTNSFEGLLMDAAYSINNPVKKDSYRWSFTAPEAGELRYSRDMIARSKDKMKLYNPVSGEYELKDISKWDYFTENLKGNSKIITEANPNNPDDFTMIAVKPDDIRYHGADTHQMSIWGAQKKYGSTIWQYPLALLNGVVFNTLESIGRIGQSIDALFAGNVDDPTELSNFWSGWSNMFAGLSYKPSEEIESAGFFGSPASFGYNLSKLVGMLLPQRWAAGAATGALKGIAKGLGTVAGKTAIKQTGRWAAITVGSTQASSAMYEAGLENNIDRKTSAWLTLGAMPAVALTEYFIGSKWISGQLDDDVTRTGMVSAVRNSMKEVSKTVGKEPLSKSVNKLNRKITLEAAKEIGKGAAKATKKGAKFTTRGLANTFDAARKMPVFKGAMREGAQEGLEEMYYVGLEAAHDTYWYENEHARPGQGLFGTEWYGSEEWSRIFENAMAGSIAGGFADPMFDYADTRKANKRARKSGDEGQMENKSFLDGFLTGFKDGFKKDNLNQFTLKNVKTEEQFRKATRILSKLHRNGKLGSMLESITGEKVTNDELENFKGQTIKAGSMPGVKQDFEIKNMNDLAYFQLMQNMNMVLDGMRVAGVTPKNAQEKLANFDGEEDLFRKAIDLGYRINIANNENERLNKELVEAKQANDTNKVQQIESKLEGNNKDIEGMSQLLDYLAKPTHEGRSKAYLDRLFQTFMREQGKEYTLEDMENVRNNKELKQFKEEYVNKVKERRNKTNEVSKYVEDEFGNFIGAFFDIAEGSMPDEEVDPNTNKTYGELRQNAIKQIDELHKKVTEGKVAKSDLSDDAQNLMNSLATELSDLNKFQGIADEQLKDAFAKMQGLGEDYSSLGTQAQDDVELAKEAEKDYLFSELKQGLKTLNEKLARKEATNDDKIYLEQLLNRKEKVEEALFASNALDYLTQVTGYQYSQKDQVDEDGNFQAGSLVSKESMDEYESFIANPAVYMSDKHARLLKPTSDFDLISSSNGIHFFGKKGKGDQTDEIETISLRRQFPDGRIAQVDLQEGQAYVSFVNEDGSLSEKQEVDQSELSEDEQALSNPAKNLQNALEKANELDQGFKHDLTPYYTFDQLDQLFGKTAESRRMKEVDRRYVNLKNNMSFTSNILLTLISAQSDKFNQSESNELNEIGSLLNELVSLHNEDVVIKDNNGESTGEVNQEVLAELEKNLLEIQLKISNVLKSSKSKDAIVKDFIDRLHEEFSGKNDKPRFAYNENRDTKLLKEDDIKDFNAAELAKFDGHNTDLELAQQSYYIKSITNILHRMAYSNMSEFYQLYDDTISEINDGKIPSIQQQENILQAFINITEKSYPYLKRASVSSFGVINSETAEQIDEENIALHEKFPFRGFNFLGYGGTGKSTVMMGTLLKILNRYNSKHGKKGLKGNKHDVLLVAPSRKMTKVLSEQAQGLKNVSYDILSYQDYLEKVDNGDIKDGDYALTVIDEISRMNEKELAIFHNRMKGVNDAFLFMGDPEQASNNEKQNANFNGTAGQFLAPSDGIVTEIYRTDIVDISLLQNSISKAIGESGLLDSSKIEFPKVRHNEGNTKGVRYYESTGEVVEAWIEDISKNENEAENRVLIFATSQDRDQFLERNKENPKITALAENVRYVNQNSSTEGETIQGEEVPYVYAALTAGNKHESMRIFKTATSRAEKFVATVGPINNSELKPDDEVIDLSEKEDKEGQKEMNKLADQKKELAKELSDIAQTYKNTEKKEETKKKKDIDEEPEGKPNRKTKRKKTIIRQGLDGKRYTGLDQLTYDMFEKNNFEPEQNSNLDKKGYIGKRITYDGRNFKVLELQRMKEVGTDNKPFGKLKKVYILKEEGVSGEESFQLIGTNQMRSSMVLEDAPIQEDPTNNALNETVNDPPVYSNRAEEQIANSALHYDSGKLRILPLITPAKGDAATISSDDLFNAENIRNGISAIGGNLRIKYFAETPKVYSRQEDGTYAQENLEDVLAIVDQNDNIIGYLFNPDNISEQVSEEFIADNKVVRDYIDGLKAIKKRAQSGEEISLNGNADVINGGYATYSDNIDDQLSIDKLINKANKQQVELETKENEYQIDPSKSDLLIQKDTINGKIYYYIKARYSGLKKTFRIYLNNDFLSNHKTMQKKLNDSIDFIEAELKKVDKIDINTFFAMLNDPNSKAHDFNKFFSQNRSIFNVEVDGQIRIKKDWKDLLYLDNKEVKISFDKKSNSGDIWAKNITNRLRKVAKYINQNGYAPVLRNKDGHFIVGSYIKSNLEEMMMPQLTIDYIPQKSDASTKGLSDEGTDQDTNRDKASFFEENDLGMNVKPSDLTDVNAEESYLRQLLGNEIVDNRYDFEIYRGDKIWGYVKDLRIILRKNAQGKTVEGIASHEAVHFTLRYMMPESESNSILNDTKRHIARNGKWSEGDITNKYAEEWLAEASRGKKELTSNYTGIVGKVKQFVDWITDLFFNVNVFGDYAYQYITDLHNGKFRDGKIMTQNYGDEAAYLSTETTSNENENLFENTRNEELTKYFGEGKFYAKIKREVSSTIKATSIYNGVIIDNIEKQQIRQLSDTLPILEDYYKKDLIKNNVDTSIYKKYNTFDKVLNKFGRAGLRNYYDYLLSQPDMLALIYQDIIPGYDTSEDGVNKAQKTFNDPNSISHEQYMSKNSKLFLKTIPKATPRKVGALNMDADYVNDPDNPYLNYSKLNEILKEFISGLPKDLDHVDIMREMADYVMENLDRSDDTKDVETIEYLTSFLKEMGYFENINAEAEGSSERRIYGHIDLAYNLQLVAARQNIDLSDSKSLAVRKLLQISEAHNNLLNSIFNHYKNLQTLKFVTVAKASENSNSPTSYVRKVKLSTGQNENYNHLRYTIQNNLYGDNSETLKDSFLDQLNEKDGKGRIRSLFNIDSSNGNITITHPRNRTQRLTVLKYSKKGNKYIWAPDVDANIVRKLSSYLGLNLSNTQVRYIFEGFQKSGFANRSNFGKDRLADMFGHMFQAAYIAKNEMEVKWNSGNLLSRSLAEYMKDQMKLIDGDQIKLNDFMDDLKDMAFKLSEVNSMITNRFVVNADGDKRFAITQHNEASRMINGEHDRPNRALDKKYKKKAVEIEGKGINDHYFITPKGKLLDPFIGNNKLFAFKDYEVMLMMDDGFTSKDFKKLDDAEMLTADMDVFFQSVYKNLSDGKVRVSLNSWGESHTKPYLEIAVGGLFNVARTKKNDKYVTVGYKTTKEGLTHYFDKMLHQSLISLEKMSVLIYDETQEQVQVDSDRQKDLEQYRKYLNDIRTAINRKGLSYTESLTKANELIYKYLDKLNINSNNEQQLLQYLSKKGLIRNIDFRYGTVDGKSTLRTTAGFNDDVVNIYNMKDLAKAKTEKEIKGVLSRMFKKRATDLVYKANERGMPLSDGLRGDTNYNKVFGDNKSIEDPAMLYLLAHYFAGESFDTLFSGHHKQEKNPIGTSKRSKKNSASGVELNTIKSQNVRSHNITNKVNVLRVFDTTKQFEELAKFFPEKNSEYEATDGAFIENPVFAMLRANSVGDTLSIFSKYDKTSKTIDTGLDSENGLGVMAKNAGFVINQDILDYHPKSDTLMRMFLAGGNSVSGYDQNYLYDIYQESISEGKTLDEAIDDVHYEIIRVRFKDNVDLSDLMISRIEHKSGNKYDHGGQNYLTFDDVMNRFEEGKYDEVIKSESEMDNTRMILSHNMDLRKTEATMLSQAFSSLVMDMSQAGYGEEVEDAIRQITRDAFANIESKYENNFESEYRNDAVQGMSSYKDASALMNKVASHNTSIQIPTFVGKTLPSFMRQYKKAINFKTNGWKLVQAPAFMMKQYAIKDDFGHEYYVSHKVAEQYAAEQNISVDELQTKDIESYKFNKVDGKIQISRPEEVIMSLPNMSALGIDPNDRASLNELLSIQINGNRVNVREYVRKHSENYYMDMSDGIDALIALLKGSRLDALSDGGSRIDMDTFLGNAYVIKAMQKLYGDDAASYITSPEEIADWFEKLLRSTLVTTTRIPTNNWAANAAAEIVGIAYDSGSVIYRSAERTTLDDSDFDIDQLTALFQNFENIGQKDNDLKNRIQDNFYKALMSPENIDLTTMQMEIADFKKLVDKVRSKRMYYHNHPPTSAELTHAALIGERMVGYVANGINIFNRIMSMSTKDRAKLLGFDNIDSSNKEEYIERVRVFSELLQTAVDNQNDPVIQFFGLNPVTSNVITAMALEGKTTEEIYNMLNDENISDIINQTVRSRRIMGETKDIRDFVEQELHRIERLMSEEANENFITNWINDYKKGRDAYLELKEEALFELDNAKESGSDEAIKEAKENLKLLEKRYKKTAKEYEKQLTDYQLADKAEKEYNNAIAKKDLLAEFNLLLAKGEFISRLSRFSLHQGYEVREGDIYMLNKAWEEFTGQQITDYNNKEAETTLSIEEKFSDKEGYQQKQEGDERVRSYEDAQQRMSMINNSINRVGIQGVLNREGMDGKPANVTFVTNGQHGVDSLINFSTKYNGRDTKVKHVVPTKVFDNMGLKMDSETFAKKLKDGNSQHEVETTGKSAKKVMEENVKNSDGLIMFINGSSKNWELGYMSRLSKEYGKKLHVIDMNMDLKDIQNKFGEAMVAIHKKKLEQVKKEGGNEYAAQDLNVVTTGPNSMSLMYESETEFEKSVRREKEVRSIGNLKDVLHAMPNLDLYMNGYVKANKMLSRNLLTFSSFVQDIAHKHFLKPIGQKRFRSKKQYYSFMEAFHASILSEVFQEGNQVERVSNYAEYIPKSLESLDISLRGYRDLNLSNYWDAQIFARMFPEFGAALKYNPEFQHNFFIQHLEVQNGKLIVKGAMGMDDGQINRLMIDMREIKRSHPDLYQSFKNYTFVTSGLTADRNSLVNFLDENIYKEISQKYEQLMTYAQAYASDPNRTIADIQQPFVKKILSGNFPEMVGAYSLDSLIYHNRSMREAGYYPSLVKKNFLQRNQFTGDVLFSYMAPHKLNEKTMDYDKQNSMLSKRVRILPLTKNMKGMTNHEVIMPENANQMIQFEEGKTVTIKKTSHGYTSGNGYFLDREAYISVNGNNIQVKPIKSKRQDIRYLGSEHQAAKVKQSSSATAFVSNIAQINGMEDVIQIETKDTSAHPELLSYIQDGIIHFNVDNMRGDTLVHEFGHVLMDVGLNASSNTGMNRAATKLYQFAQEALRNEDPIAMKVMNAYPELTGNDLIKEIAVTILGFRATNTTAAMMNGLGQKETGRLINQTTTFEAMYNEDMPLSFPLTGFGIDDITLSSSIDDITNALIKDLINGEFGNNQDVRDYLDSIRNINPENSYIENEAIQSESNYIERQESLEELFESNPELANAVYEVLGFGNKIKPTGTINVYWKQAESKTSTRVLSNLAPRKFTWEGREYGSVEHAYQSNKSGTFDQATYDAYNNIGGYGKKIRGKGTVAEMKAADSLGLMKKLVVESFKQNPNPEATKKLLQYENFTHNTNELIDKAFLEGLKLAQKELLSNVQTTPQQKQLAQQLYSKYLDTIFPDSKVKHIVYHGALQNKYKGNRNNLSSLFGLWLTNKKGAEYFQIPRDEENNNEFTRSIINTYGINPTDKELYDYHKNVIEKFYPGIQSNKEKESYIQGFIKAFKSDLKSLGEIIPEIINAELKELDISVWKELLNKGDETKIKEFKEQIKKEGYNGVYIKNTDKQFDSGYDQYVVFEPEQIHILGSKQDIEGFKKFANDSLYGDNLTQYELSLVNTKRFKDNFKASKSLDAYSKKGIRVMNINGQEISTEFFNDISGNNDVYVYTKGTFDEVIDNVIQNEFEKGNVVIFC